MSAREQDLFIDQVITAVEAMIDNEWSGDDVRIDIAQQVADGISNYAFDLMVQRDGIEVVAARLAPQQPTLYDALGHFNITLPVKEAS